MNMSIAPMAPAQAHGLELGAETRLCSLPDDLALHPF